MPAWDCSNGPGLHACLRACLDLPFPDGFVYCGMQLAEGEKELKRQAFERALAVPDEAPVSDQIVLEEIVVDDSYSGPRMEGAC